MTKTRILGYVVVFELLGIIGLVMWLALFNQPRSTQLVSTAEPKKVALHTPVIASVPFASGLTAPVDIVSLPTSVKDDRLFVVEQAGVIRTMSSKGQVGTTPFLDITSKVKSGGEMGLLGLAFDPNYAKTGYIYVNYIDQTMNTVVARFTVAKTTGLADPASQKIVLTQKQPFQNHNGGALRFGPDGYLYIAFGDGGSAGDPDNRAQNKNDWLGKILRVDIKGTDTYKVPATNPFVGQATAKPEIWSMGLRNPWKISFDRKTGDLYMADVGQGTTEEINVQPRASKGGENYGWRCYEGTHTFNTAGGCKPANNYTMPAIEYDHSDNRCSVTGGSVYRGTSQKALAGTYFYADYCGGQLYYAKKEKGTWKSTLAATNTGAVSTFGEDQKGELYYAEYKSGQIYHITDDAN
ncbi:MAG TPA: PQQ-dependent sugar dehydrogenase [Candidatus Saccharimonadales bacterium]|nr:PQQ-dependent sugar dehydrogenase [Candidatus Saccharimonadales bacterium]